MMWHCIASSLLVAVLFSTQTLAIVLLDYESTNDTVCRGASVVFTCTTVSQTGYLEWINSSKNYVTFNDTTMIGSTATLGNITLNLTHKAETAEAHIYTSTATLTNTMQDTTIKCSDGFSLLSRTVEIRNPSQPTWSFSACSFSQGNVQLSWNEPSDAADCCVLYEVEVSNGRGGETNGTKFTLPLEEGASYNASVRCLDPAGEMGPKSDVIQIRAGPMDIDSVTIGATGGGCNGPFIDYQITWAVNDFSSGDTCTPSVTTAVVTCGTNSTIVSRSSTAYCEVGPDEVLNTTVTLINSAGFNASRSISADALAAACLDRQDAQRAQNMTKDELANCTAQLALAKDTISNITEIAVRAQEAAIQNARYAFGFGITFFIVALLLGIALVLVSVLCYCCGKKQWCQRC